MKFSVINTCSALLFALLQGEGYGLQLIVRVKQLSTGIIILQEPSVYPALGLMQSEGLVTSSDEKQPHGGRPRRYYRLTEEGTKVATGQRRALQKLLGGEDMKKKAKAPARQCIIGEYCERHEFIHGYEAEELRVRLEKLIGRKRDVGRSEVGLEDLQAILDDVDARDSVAFLERRPPRRRQVTAKRRR